MNQGLYRFIVSVVACCCIFLTGYGQFSHRPKKTNLIVNFNKEIGWELTDISANKTYLTIPDENLYLEFSANELRVYSMSEALWNTHPSADFMDNIHMEYQVFQVDTNTAVFSSFSALWLSSAGGHLRIFKYPQYLLHTEEDGSQSRVYNQNVQNQLFLNQTKSAKITSHNNIFMISPQGHIFEIDHGQNMWRFIFKNRTLTPWTSKPPSQNLIFYIFKKENYKNVIPVGSKDGHFWFQIIDHQNKMGLASLSQDYFQVEIRVPPLFDFISPSLKANEHLIYDHQKLGLLYFLPVKEEGDIPEFLTFYTPAKTKLYADARSNGSGKLLADGQIFSVVNSEAHHSSTIYRTDFNYGLKVVHDDLLLYTEYSENLNISHSGLYRISQNQWYLNPEYGHIKRYPTAVLQVDNIMTKKPNSYSVYTINGDKRIMNVTDLNSPKFKQLLSLLIETPVDSISPLLKYDSITYRYRSLTKWGVVSIENENVLQLVPPAYDHIAHFGVGKSLLLIHNNQFDWYGKNYCQAPANPILLKKQSHHLKLLPGNAMDSSTTCSPRIKVTSTAKYQNKHFIYNIHTEGLPSPIDSSWISDDNFITQYSVIGKIEPFNGFFNVVHSQSGSMQLLNKRLKPVSIPNYNFILEKDKALLLFNRNNANDENINLNLVQPLAASFHDGKSLRLSKKFNQSFYYDSFIIGEKKQLWHILLTDGSHLIPTPFHTQKSALDYLNSRRLPIE